jgi:hypothetical protein
VVKREIPGQRTLDDAPTRVCQFLIGLAKSLPARAALEAKGFGQAEQEYAWSRLQLLFTLPGPPPALDATVRNAILELDDWDGPNFEAIENTLLWSYPEQARFLFDGLTASDGAESVLGVELLLARLNALESGVGRNPATREADCAALALLEKRGYSKSERERLRALVSVVKSVPPTPAVDRTLRDAAQLDLYRWLSEWSAHARNAQLGRSALITLGVAERRKRTDDTDADDSGAGSKLRARPRVN